MVKESNELILSVKCNSNVTKKKKKNIKEHTPNWSQFPFHQHRILIIKGSGSGKTN